MLQALHCAGSLSQYRRYLANLETLQKTQENNFALILRQLSDCLG